MAKFPKIEREKITTITRSCYNFVFFCSAVSGSANLNFDYYPRWITVYMYVNLLIILLIKPSLPQQIHPKAIPKESCFYFDIQFSIAWTSPLYPFVRCLRYLPGYLYALQNDSTGISILNAHYFSGYPGDIQWMSYR